MLYQNVINFLHAALECSIYANPGDPGLTLVELTEAAHRAGFRAGEINDARPKAVTQYFDNKTKRINIDKYHAMTLTVFTQKELPDYRNPCAFHRVFKVIRRTVRERGLANARLTRSGLVEMASSDDTAESDIQIAIAILLLNEILVQEAGMVRFGPSKEGYGSPGDAGNLRDDQMGTIQKSVRAQAYPIVGNLIAERHQPVATTTSVKRDAANDEWLTASVALDLTAQGYGQGSRAICKRAHAGLIQARAKRFMKDSQSVDNVEVPSQFWWAEGEEALEQNWTTGDFETWIDRRYHLRAFGVEFRRSDIEKIAAHNAGELSVTGSKIFIGHGGSLVWKDLRDFLRDRLDLTVDEYNNVSTAGISTADRLAEMLKGAKFAFLIMTAEDEQPDGTMRAQENVIHEAGLFQGKLGFKKAIVLLEEGCTEFSNITGLGQIRFASNNLTAKFEEIRGLLEREKIIPAARA